MTDCLPSKVYPPSGKPSGDIIVLWGDNPSYHTLARLIIVYYYTIIMIIIFLSPYIKLSAVFLTKHQADVNVLGVLKYAWISNWS